MKQIRIVLIIGPIMDVLNKIKRYMSLKLVPFISAVLLFILTLFIFTISIYCFVRLFIDWNWAITNIFVHFPYNLRYLLILLCSVILCIIPIVILNLKWPWQKKILNRLVLWLLERYITVDPSGRVYIFIRHISHIFFRRLLSLTNFFINSIINYILNPGIRLYNSRIRRIPFIKKRKWKSRSYIKSKKVGNLIPLYKSHYEEFLLEELAAADIQTRQFFEEFRAVILHNPPAGDILKVLQKLQNVLEKEFKLLSALSDYLICPYCMEYILKKTRFSIPKLWVIIEKSDLLCSRIKLLLYQLEGWEKNRYFKEFSKYCDKLKNRLQKYYKEIEERLSIAGAFPAAQDFFKELVIFRQLLFKKGIGNIGKKKTNDLWLLRRRSQIIGNSVPAGSNYLKFAVRTLSFEFIFNKDWLGIIEMYRLLSIKNDYEPNVDDYLDLGEAYWYYAKELGNSTLGNWALTQSFKYYYRAKAEKHLEKLACHLEEET